ncbi:MAG: hypothetical protein FWC90_03755 [Oscillospiraceae bacterium]|nr:hypothetical protein [Oscillospiraceae bacterium]
MLISTFLYFIIIAVVMGITIGVAILCALKYRIKSRDTNHNNRGMHSDLLNEIIEKHFEIDFKG